MEKNGRWQMTNKAEDTITEGRKLAPQNTRHSELGGNTDVER